MKRLRLIHFLVWLLPIGCDRSESDWQKALESNTVEAFAEYIRKYPESTYLARAHSQISSLEWEEAARVNTVSQYERYIAKYPASLNSIEAQKAIFEAVTGLRISSNGISLSGHFFGITRIDHRQVAFRTGASSYSQRDHIFDLASEYLRDTLSKEGTATALKPTVVRREYSTFPFGTFPGEGDAGLQWIMANYMLFLYRGADLVEGVSIVGSRQVTAKPALYFAFEKQSDR